MTTHNANNERIKRRKRPEQLSIGATLEQVEQLIKPFATEIPITVLDSVTDLGPVEMQGYLTSGVTMNGRIHLFHDGLRDSADVARTLWHELLHFGLRRFLTQDQYIKQIDRLYLNDAWVRNKVDAWVSGEDGKALLLGRAAAKRECSIFYKQ